MPITGTLDMMPLCDLMQWIHSAQKTGTLTVTVDTQETYLTFQHGQLEAFGTDDPLRTDLGQMLLGRGLLGEAELQAALRLVRVERGLADVLAQTGLLGAEQIAAVQIDHALETVLDLFFQNEGSFHFTNRSSPSILSLPETPLVNRLGRPIPTGELLMEGMRRVDEWARIREVFPSLLVLVAARLPLDAAAARNRVIQELLQIGHPISVGELCLRLGGSRFRIHQELFAAQQAGSLAVEKPPSGPSTATPTNPVELLLQTAEALLQEEQFDEAKEVLGTAANLDPDHPRPHQLLQQAREAQLQHLYQQVPPHRVPVLAVPHEKLSEYALGPRETYLASRLNGHLDVATLVVATPVGELETLRVLAKLLHAGLVKFLG
ncbi:MAG TPA: DUF4388 domain-containing protein [Myxococcota bacterium]|nr:DUF4388 domain-containing protein [Myxococcota bacterium]HRY94975.1 DUF4388 domain-containing protein [Myxococcota bacterium]HSA20966.1 DUF4388 domain-containing protein [Myxococcota bacterium]